MREPPSAPASDTACSTIVVSTSSWSRVSELIALPISASACISSTLRVSPARCTCRAENSCPVRTASAACAANVVSSRATCSSKGRTWVRHTSRTPTTSSSTIMGAPIIERYPPRRWNSGRL